MVDAQTPELAVDDAAHVKAEHRDNSAMRVDNRRDAIIGGADERQALLDGAHAGLMEVLARAGRVAEPAIVGDIDQQPGRSAPCTMAAGKIAS